MKRSTAILSAGLLIAGLITLNQNCSKVGITASDNASELLEKYAVYPTTNALAYGSTADDQQFLSERIKGKPGPGVREIFDRWRRFSNNTIYASAAVVQPEPENAFCFTGLDQNGDFKMGTRVVDGKTVTFNPNGVQNCIDSTALAAVSWSFRESPARIRNAVNAGNFNGFVSSVKFENFTSEATLPSPGADDDAIALVIATVIKDGKVHSLIAQRHQGGTTPSETFSILYRQGNVITKVLAAKMVGVTNKNKNSDKTGGTGDTGGWSGRMTRVRVQRDGDKITAAASDFNVDPTKLVIKPADTLTVDLSNLALGLEIFRGPQYYGYGILSQYGSEFRDIAFTTTTPDRYLYDLPTDRVYEQKPTGGYAVAPGKSAFTMLTFPINVVNTEIQKQFRLNKDRTFRVIND